MGAVLVGLLLILEFVLFRGADSRHKQMMAECDRSEHEKSKSKLSSKVKFWGTAKTSLMWAMVMTASVGLVIVGQALLKGSPVVKDSPVLVSDGLSVQAIPGAEMLNHGTPVLDEEKVGIQLKKIDSHLSKIEESIRFVNEIRKTSNYKPWRFRVEGVEDWVGTLEVSNVIYDLEVDFLSYAPKQPRMHDFTRAIDDLNDFFLTLPGREEVLEKVVELLESEGFSKEQFIVRRLALKL